MNWNVLITFGIGLAIYFLGLGGWILFKRYKNKKKFDKEVNDKEGKDNGEK